MIDVFQWRATIGQWSCCGSRGKREVFGNFTASFTSDVSMRWAASFMITMGDFIITWMMSLSFFFLILLSGDVEINPGPLTGNSKDHFRSNFDKLTDAITTNLTRIINGLYAKELIPQSIKNDLQTIMGLSDYDKASRLMSVLEQQLELSSDPDQYLINICQILINQEHQSLKDIATSILQNLGQSVTDKSVTMISGPNSDVQRYAGILKDRYTRQPIVATDWPPRVGKDFFGRLVIIEPQDSNQQKNTAWYMLRGEIDIIPELSGHKEVTIEEVLQGPQPLSLVIDGPPGIGKTTLCRKLCSMWANGTLSTQYDLVLYCPLRNRKIATANTLSDLFLCQCHEVSMAATWFQKNNGEGLLIIFDGWDELNTNLRYSSLAADIISKNYLAKCSVLVTSRSYASFSVLKFEAISKHYQIIGFTKEEIATVIQETLKDKNPELAEKLVNDLEVRKDVQSLCYVPLVCSMAILVFCKLEGHLPTTLTELYDNFILQTIRRHIEKKAPQCGSIEAKQLSSLDHLPSVLAKSLQEMCQFAFINLNNNRITFYYHHFQQSLNQAIKEDYLGLITSFPEYDEEIYQFLHLSVQEFLAARWIVKSDDLKANEVFKEHFDNNDHFRMCLRFIAGLTHLKPEECYQEHFKPLNMQCKRRPLFGFERIHDSWFYQNPDIDTSSIRKGHFISDRPANPIIFPLHVLYESQNTKLCEIFAHSICSQSLCFHAEMLSLFDILCLGYFLYNSNTTWTHLDLFKLSDKSLSILNIDIISQSQCKRLEVTLDAPSDTLLHTFLKSSLIRNIQECYCVVKNSTSSYNILLQFFLLSRLKILHLTIEIENNTKQDESDNFTDIEKSLTENFSLQELKLVIKNNDVYVTPLLTSVIVGIAKNKSVISFAINIPKHVFLPLPEGTIEHLLQYNYTLQKLVLCVHDNLLPSSFNIKQVNAPLTALQIEGKLNNARNCMRLTSSLLPLIKELRCLSLLHHEPQYSLTDLFHFNPSLQVLSISLSIDLKDLLSASTHISVVDELFNIIKSNTTLKGLRLETMNLSCSSCTNLLDMLTQNQTLNYLKIESPGIYVFSNSYLSSLTTGLLHNNFLHELSIPVPTDDSTIESIGGLFEAISQSKNIIELTVHFTFDQCYYDGVLVLDVHANESDDLWKMKLSTNLIDPNVTRTNFFCGVHDLTCSYCVALMFFKLALPLVNIMLEFHKTIKSLKVECAEVYEEISEAGWEEPVEELYKTIFCHPSLEYFRISTDLHSGIIHPLIGVTFEKHAKKLADLHRTQQPLTPQPIVDYNILHI